MIGGEPDKLVRRPAQCQVEFEQAWCEGNKQFPPYESYGGHTDQPGKCGLDGVWNYKGVGPTYNDVYGGNCKDNVTAPEGYPPLQRKVRWA